jgi:U3 small nucleolar RNA-associated protein 12
LPCLFCRSLAPLPDASGFVSGSADHDVKFWDWTLDSAPDGDGRRQLGIAHTRTLQMTDDVLGVKISPNGKLLAISLLDSTVRVFFVDSLKFFLSLYGHKLPVLSMDISSDSTLLVTGSADKNIKIWGLDFGDCHRSLFAHSDSVMAVAFVAKTHYVFTAGKDGAVKYWDADKFEQLLTLEGHHSEVWCLVVSSLGEFVVTGSRDRSLRRWERTDEPFFVEEEKEKRLESLFEADLEAADRAPLGMEGSDVTDAVAPAGRKTLETVSAADAIVDALDLAGEEEERVRQWEEDKRRNPAAKPAAANPLLMGASASDHVLSSVAGVKSGDLEQALLLLPFTDALRLLGYVVGWLRAGSRVELLCRVAVLLLRLHLRQLSATPAARGTLAELQGLLRKRVQEVKDLMGFNLAGLEHLQRGAAAARGGGGAADFAVLPLKRKATPAAA